jgi:conjugative transfer region protein (TIGR03748 family)
VVRYGRYTLAELTPQPAQRDLLQQVIEIAMPATPNAGVGDAMRHVLARTGYRMCETQDVAALYAFPLPAAHLRLGPLMLRDALRVLAGPAWMLEVDEAAREVCFRFDSAHPALDQHLAHVEQAQALQTRIDAIEARLNEAAVQTPTPRRTAESPKPATPIPPFKVMGLELRGSERFLSVLPSNTMAVRDVQLLREGDRLGRWQLQSIDGQAAVFRIQGQPVRVAVP